MCHDLPAATVRYQATNPSLRAIAMACVRLPARSLQLMLRKCARTVDSEMQSCLAIPSLECPQANKFRICRVAAR